MSAAVEQWRSLVDPALSAWNSSVPPALVLAIIDAESGGDPHAYRGEPAIGDGSIGLMQILQSTASGLGWSGAPSDRATGTGLFDPVINIYYGVGFLTDLWNQLGDPADVASAYNGGIRPSLGFGGVLTGSSPVTVCLARDRNGNCTNRHTVQPGEYGNAAYVNRVLGLMAAYGGSGDTWEPPAGDSGTTGTPGGGAAVASTGALLGLAVAGAAAFALFRRRRG